MVFNHIGREAEPRLHRFGCARIPFPNAFSYHTPLGSVSWQTLNLELILVLRGGGCSVPWWKCPDWSLDGFRVASSLTFFAAGSPVTSGGQLTTNHRQQATDNFLRKSLRLATCNRL